MTAYGQSDVEFYDESYGAKDVAGLCWVRKFYMKNLEKVEKIMNIQEYPTKFLHFTALLFFLLVCAFIWIGQNLNI